MTTNSGSDTYGYAGIVMILALCAVAAALIAWRRRPEQNIAISYFVLGIFLGPIGVLLSFFVRPAIPAPIPPGWYADPWGIAPGRWHDGTQWTGYTRA